MKVAVLTVWTFIIIRKAYGDVTSEGMLYPRESETREVISLNGIWNFVVSPTNDPLAGFRQYWYKTGLSKAINSEVLLMPVPSSYNDITQDPNIRDHVGLVWYERTFFVPESWSQNKSRILLRFSSVSYAAQVWLNGDLLMNHEIGHLPFQKEINSFLNFGKINRVTVACDNTLLQDTVPQGWINEVKTSNGIKLNQNINFDFFNYAGIHRPVMLHTTPWTYIDDVTLETELKGTTGIVYYNISYQSDQEIRCVVIVVDKSGNNIVKEEGGKEGYLKIHTANLWWPYLMHPDPGYMYTLQVELRSEQGNLLDIYRQPFGIRTISWTNTSLLINNKQLYLHGFGRHEDADIRGKGVDLPIIIKDHNLIKWIGGNAYRTSHYPYCDEIMDVADQMGIMIIDECPSVNTDFFSYNLLVKHKESLTELIKRDKNRPSVIMWSIANEPSSQKNAADAYFEEVAAHVRNLDGTRPITIAISQNVNADKAGRHLDIISFNRYNSWYSNTGKLDTITQNVVNEARNWHKKHNKPVLMSEYGADTVAGLHISPSYVFSEEFQVSMMSRHFEAFDVLRAEGWFIGEFIWNFADFKTEQTITRVGGNKKGIFTRERQPKASAHHLRRRYFALANELYNTTQPDDIEEYIISKQRVYDEL